MRSNPYSPFGMAWTKAANVIRAQNTDKNGEELKWIIGVEYYKFLPKWDTYVYVK
jgi:hypothetical protein